MSSVESQVKDLPTCSLCIRHTCQLPQHTPREHLEGFAKILYQIVHGYLNAQRYFDYQTGIASRTSLRNQLGIVCRNLSIFFEEYGPDLTGQRFNPDMCEIHWEIMMLVLQCKRLVRFLFRGWGEGRSIGKIEWPRFKGKLDREDAKDMSQDVSSLVLEKLELRGNRLV